MACCNTTGSRQGSPRKYYELTDLGRQTLRELDEAWNEIANTVNYLKNKHQQNT